MRLTKEKAALNRTAILDAAGRLFRERGIDAVSVADLMDAAGFTHGGFYNHFSSKEALACEVVEAAALRASEGLPGGPGATSKSLAQYVEGYLSPAHRDDPSHGCTVCALAGDAGRQGADLQEPFRENVEIFLGAVVADLLERNGEKGKRAEAAARRKAVRLWSEMVGAMTLARAVASASPSLSDEILSASRKGCAEELREGG